MDEITCPLCEARHKKEAYIVIHLLYPVGWKQTKLDRLATRLGMKLDA